MNAVKNRFESLKLTDKVSLVHIAHKGVKTAIFYSFAQAASLTEGFLASLLNMHPRTIQNYKEKQKKLDPPESEHLLKMIALYIKGEELFGNANEFNHWLNKPFWKSDNKPSDLLITPGGIDILSDELDRLTHGYAV